MPTPQQRMVLMIDALDESERQGYNELLEALGKCLDRLPSWLSVATSSRPETPIVRVLSQCRPHRLQRFDSSSDVVKSLSESDKKDYEANLKANLADLRAYIETQLKRKTCDSATKPFLRLSMRFCTRRKVCSCMSSMSFKTGLPTC